MKIMNFHVHGDVSKTIAVQISDREQQIFERVFRFQSDDEIKQYIYDDMIDCLDNMYSSFEDCKQDYEQCFNEIVDSLASGRIVCEYSSGKITDAQRKEFNALLTTAYIFSQENIQIQ